MRITPAPVSPKSLAKAKKRSAIYNYYKRLVDVGLSPEKAIITTYKDLNIDKVKVRDAIDRIESGAEKLYKGVLPTDKDLNNLTESGSGQIDDALVNQVNGQIKEIVGDGRIKDPIAKAQLYVKIYEVYTYYRTQGNGQEAATSFTVASMRMKRPIVNEAIKVVERLRPTFRYLERVRPLAEQSAIDKKEIAEYVKNAMLPHSDLSENEKNVFRSVLSHVSSSTLTTILAFDKSGVKRTLCALEEEILSYAQVADEGGEYTAPENALCDSPADIYEAIKSLPLPLEKSFLRYAMIRVVLARVFDYFMHADTLLDYAFSKE